MAQTSRITNAGTYFVNGSFDEFTGAPVVDSSLLLWLDAGQTSSYPGTGTTWTDLSTSGNNGTLTSTSFTNDQYGGFTTYNGSSSYATLTPAKYNTTYTGKTVFAVVRMNSSFGSGFRGILGTADSVNIRNFNTYLYYDGTGYRIHFSYGTGTANNGTLSNYLTVSLNQWFIVAVTQNASSHSYYMNGIFDVSRSGGYTAYNTTTNEFVGRADGYWYGDIAQVMVYTRELSASEIAQNYNALCQRYGLAPIRSTQMPVVKRETSAGTILINSGVYDEVTYSNTSPVFQNLLTYSQQLDNAAWSQSAVGVTANVLNTLSPINDQTVEKIYETATTASHNLQYGSVAKAANAVLTFSVFAKSAERSWIGLVINDDVGGFGVGRYGAEFDLAAGSTYQHDPAQGTYTSGSQTITAVGNGWYRCSITCTTFNEATSRARIYLLNSNTTSVTTWTSAASYTGDGSSGTYVWGAQLEVGTSPTIYQGVAAANTLVTPSFVKRESNTGSIYVTGNFDEYTGILNPGLYKTTYAGYFSDNVSFFATATPTTYGTNPSTSVQTDVITDASSDDGSNFSCQWLGYFIPTTTEVHTFYLTSDDASYMWLGDTAVTGFANTNPLVNNGSLHGNVEASGSISLTSGTKYPVRIQFGEAGGGDVMILSYATPTITKSSNVIGKVFYNDFTSGL